MKRVETGSRNQQFEKNYHIHKYIKGAEKFFLEHLRSAGAAGFNAFGNALFFTTVGGRNLWPMGADQLNHCQYEYFEFGSGGCDHKVYS